MCCKSSISENDLNKNVTVDESCEDLTKSFVEVFKICVACTYVNTYIGEDGHNGPVLFKYKQTLPILYLPIKHSRSQKAYGSNSESGMQCYQK